MVSAQNKRLTIADVNVQLPMKKAGIGSVGSVLSRLSERRCNCGSCRSESHRHWQRQVFFFTDAANIECHPHFQEVGVTPFIQR